MEEIGSVFQTVKWLVILGIIVAVPLFIAGAAIAYWWVSVPVIAAAIAAVVYWKRQKAAANRV